MPKTRMTRHQAGTLIFLAVALLLCYAAYGPLRMAYLVRSQPGAHLDLILPSPVDWLFLPLYAALVALALIRRWWSTLPLWIITLLLVILQIAENAAEPDSGFARGIFNTLVIPVAVQTAAFLRKDPSVPSSPSPTTTT